MTGKAGGRVKTMKHRVMVEVGKKKRFLGIPYTVTEKQKIEVDGKNYRKMKREERERKQAKTDRLAEMAVVGEYLMWEEELADWLDR